MSEIARHQLLITLVHGTWPRGFFPRIVRFKQRVRELTRRQRRNPPPFWFEEGSPFLARLGTELGDIPHKITPLLWSGANSIYVRDKTAHVLAEHLSAEHAEHPQATQLVIAHSHGGNIALRALHHLHQRDASQSCGAESANPLVVTLATPFVEVHHADFGERPNAIRAAVIIAIMMLLWILAKATFPIYMFRLPMAIFSVLLSLLFCFIWWYWSSRRATARQNQVNALRDATRLGEIVSAQAQRLLIIRAIDDEASLLLTLSTVGNYVTTRAIRYVIWIFTFLSVPLGFILFYFLQPPWQEQLRRLEEGLPSAEEWYEDAIKVVFCASILILFGLLSVVRTAHGRELGLSPMECQINTHSTPDATSLSKIVTLVRRTFVKSLRHGIYDHDDCAKVISDWVHSQLCTMLAR
jgi:hypothetical protein